MALTPVSSRAPRRTLCTVALSGLFLATAGTSLAWAADPATATPSPMKTGTAPIASAPATPATAAPSTSAPAPSASSSARQAATTPAPAQAPAATAARACSAKPVTDPMTVAIDNPGPLKAWQVLSVNFQGTLSDGHCAGDAFTFQIPQPLAVQTVGDFNLTTPDGSAVVAVMHVANNGQVTVRLTDYVETHQHVWLRGWLQVQVDGSVVPGTKSTISWTVNGRVSTIPVAYGDCDTNCAGMPTEPTKWGNADVEQRTVTSTVQTTTSARANQAFTITDTLTSPGQQFDCANPGALAWAMGFVQTDRWGEPADAQNLDLTVDSCSPHAVTVTTVVPQAKMAARVNFRASLVGDLRASYTDSATITTDGETSGTQTDVVVPKGGGEGSGDLAPTPTPTPTPEPSETPTPTPTPTPSETPTPAPGETPTPSETPAPSTPARTAPGGGTEAPSPAPAAPATVAPPTSPAVPGLAETGGAETDSAALASGLVLAGALGLAARALRRR